MIKRMYIEEDVVNATFGDIEGDEGRRLKVVEVVRGLLDEYKERGKGKGI